MRTVHIEDLKDLARGSAALGGGGGGNPYVGRLLAESAMREHGPVNLISVSDIPDEAFVLPVAMMGAPTIMLEKLPSGTELTTAMQALERWYGKKPTHLMPIEAGGINALIPFAAAAATGLPLVDGDLMGRAFPELQMVTPTLYGKSASPVALTDEKGNFFVLSAISNAWAEKIARTATVAMGCASIIALYPMSGLEARKYVVADTLSLSSDLGKLIVSSRLAGKDVGEQVAQLLGGKRIFTGKVTDLERGTVAGFARTSMILDGIESYAGQQIKVSAQNEWLVVYKNGKPIASTPDNIITLDSETGEPVTAEEVRFGFRLQIIAAPSNWRWQTDAGLELVGPSYFGFDFEFVPIDGKEKREIS